MPGRIIEIAEDDRHLAVNRGFLEVIKKGGEQETIGKIPLDDIDAVITQAHGISYTNNLLVKLAERGAPFVLCGANHNVVGMLLPVDGHHLQAARFDAQIAAKKPQKKRLWSTIVRAKILQQIEVLKHYELPTVQLEAMLGKIKSGDSSNIEAQAARRYWQLLMGAEFRRNREAEDINSFLNYGYTVLRAAIARAIVAAGLHPTIGLHHRNQANPMRLADDLIEPFRPLVDHIALQCVDGKAINQADLSAEVKRDLVHCLYIDMQTSEGTTPVTVCMQKLATSLALVFLGERDEMDFPDPFNPSD